MPLQHFTKLFGISDCKVAKLLTDPSGGPTTYSTSIDVPGVKTLAFSGQVTTKELRGDNAKLDANSVLSGIDADVTFAKMSLDILQMAIGSGAVADSGTTPNQQSKLDIKSTDTLGYFRIMGQAAAVDTGLALTAGVTFTVYKAILRDLPGFGLAEEDYETFSLPVTCLPTATGLWVTILEEETKTALT